MSGTDIDHHNSPVAATSSASEAPQVTVDSGVIDLRAPVTTEIERSIRAYRDAHSLSGGPFPQVQGLLADDIVRALEDPRTITGKLQPAGEPRSADVPVLTPVELASWYSPEYRITRFGEELAAGFTCWHLSTFPSLGDDEYASLLGRALDRLGVDVSSPAIVFADHADRQDDPSNHRLGPLLATCSRGSEELRLGDRAEVREHYLAGVFEAPEGDGPMNAARQTIDLRTQVTGATTDQRFVDELWRIYERPFKRMAESTPLRTYFDLDELAELLAKDGTIQVSHRENGRLVSWTIMTTHFDSFPWMDARSFYSTDPTIPPERVHVFPGLVTDESFLGNHCADRLFDAIALALLQQGDRHMIVFETVDDNIEFLPRLIEDAAAVNGYGHIEFRSVGAQRLRAWRLP